MKSLQPSPALARAFGIGLVTVLLGAITQRVDLVLLGLPFVVYTAWAVARRPARPGSIETEPVTMSLPEGSAVRLRSRQHDLPTGSLVTQQWPMTASGAFDPRYGTRVSVGSDDLVVGFEPLTWGRFTLDPPQIMVTDQTCAWRTVTEGAEVNLTVRPAVTTLVGGSGVSRPVGVTGLHRSVHRGDGSALADVRTFAPGDRLRRINWRVSSRTDALHVNSTLTDKDTDIVIVTDTAHDIPGAARGADTSLDNTARAVTAVAQHYLGFGDRVSVHDLGTRIGMVRPGAGPRQLRLIINVLSRAQRGTIHGDTLRRVRRLRSGALVFVCSPLLDEGVIDEVVRLRRLGGEVIVVDTLPTELGEFGTRFERDQTWFAEAWVLRRLERQTSVEQLRDHGIPVVRWRGVNSLASVLVAMEAVRQAPRVRVGR